MRTIGAGIVAALPLITALTVTSCTSVQHVTRNVVELTGQANQTQEGLTIKAKVIDLEGAKKDPRLVKNVEIKKRGVTGDMITVEVPWLLVTPPIFELRVTNATGHVVKLTGAVFRLIDAAGNLYEPVTKDIMRADTDNAIVSAQGQGMIMTPSGQSAIYAALSQLKLLDENTQLLPDMADTFFTAFKVPGGSDWLAEQTALRLKIYEVPTATNEAGQVTKRVAFEFPVTVQTYRDAYEVSLFGESKLVSTELVAK